jgi:predicted RNA-binding Zn ribbon-like protein
LIRPTLHHVTALDRSSSPAWEQRLAPEPLLLVQLFVNTHNYGVHPDRLDSPQSANMWLDSHGHSIARSDHGALLELREALRHVLLSNTGHADTQLATRELRRAMRNPILSVSFHDHGTAQLHGTGKKLEQFTSTIAATIAATTADGRWQRLKACGNPECHVAFYDHTKNNSGRYCSPDICANRTRQRAHRQRATTE